VPIQLAAPTSQHAFSAASRAEADGGTEAHRKAETGHYHSPSHLGHDPPTRIGSVEEGRLAGGRALPDRHLSYSQVPALAKQVGRYDESELCKLLLEISLLDSAYQRSAASREDVLMDAAKRYRVDAEKLQKAVAKEFAAKRDKKTIKAKGRKAAA
jgi:hypothetical protein